jgi:regulatory protein
VVKPQGGSGGEPLKAALRALSRRERSIAELAGWLGERGFSTEEVGASISKLIEIGALNDERFARAFSEDKRSLHGWGPERIAEGLAARGVSQELIDRHAGGEGHESQLERAKELLGGRRDALDDDRARARALGFLTRRGYPHEVAHEAIRLLERAG